MKLASACLSIMLGGYCAVSMAMPTDALVVEAKSDPIISVYGEATKEAIPDTAQIYGGIKLVSEKEAYESVLASFAELQSAIDGVDNVQLRSTYVYETISVYDGVVFETAGLDFCLYIESLENLTEVLQTMTEVGNVEVKSITYKLSSNEVYQKALEEATQNAIEKANALLKTEELVVEKICEEGYYFCDSSYKDFVALDDVNLIENVKVTARVKVVLGYKEETEIEQDEELEIEDKSELVIVEEK